LVRKTWRREHGMTGRMGPGEPTRKVGHANALLGYLDLPLSSREVELPED